MKAAAALLGGLVLALAARATPTQPWTAAEMAYADRLPLAPEQLNLNGNVAHLVLRTSHDRRPPPQRPELGSLQQQRLQRALCQAEAVVLARAREPLARMNTARTTVHRKVDVDVVEVIKADAEQRPGDVLPVFVLGGEVQVDGQPVRVDAIGIQLLAAGELYLLLMSRAEPSSPFFEAHGIALKDGLVRFDTGTESWFHLTGGEHYADVSAELQRLLGHACR